MKKWRTTKDGRAESDVPSPDRGFVCVATLPPTKQVGTLHECGVVNDFDEREQLTWVAPVRAAGTHNQNQSLSKVRVTTNLRTYVRPVLHPHHTTPHHPPLFGLDGWTTIVAVQGK
jgi:hypothetical protein